MDAEAVPQRHPADERAGLSGRPCGLSGREVHRAVPTGRSVVRMRLTAVADGTGRP